MQAVTDVSEMAQELMSTCEGAMAIMNCASTEGDGHEGGVGQEGRPASPRRVLSTEPIEHAERRQTNRSVSSLTRRPVEHGRRGMSIYVFVRH
jgi:hypothetical protein